jgi:hypothetical protein
MPSPDAIPSPARGASGLLIAITMLALGSGCASIRTTDPPRTATEQFLLSGAAARAIEQLSSEALRDRVVYLDSTYLGTSQTQSEYAFLVGELRARLMLAGVRLTDKRDAATIVIELRSGGLGIDRYEYLLGIPSLYIPGLSSAAAQGLPLAVPELAIVKSTKQRGYASLAFVAYWQDTGEVVASSGPYVGRTIREDWWFFGIGPRTVGNIPPAEK